MRRRKIDEGRIVGGPPLDQLGKIRVWSFRLADGEQVTVQISEFGGSATGYNFKGTAFAFRGQERAQIEGFFFNDGTGFLSDSEPWELRYVRECIRRHRKGLMA